VLGSFAVSKGQLRLKGVDTEDPKAGEQARV